MIGIKDLSLPLEINEPKKLGLLTCLFFVVNLLCRDGEITLVFLVSNYLP